MNAMEQQPRRAMNSISKRKGKTPLAVAKVWMRMIMVMIFISRHGYYGRNGLRGAATFSRTDSAMMVNRVRGFFFPCHESQVKMRHASVSIAKPLACCSISGGVNCEGETGVFIILLVLVWKKVNSALITVVVI